MMRFGGDCGRRFGALRVAVVFGFDFGGAGGWAIAGFGLGLGVIFCGRISAFGSGAFGAGLATGFGAGGFARGGAGGGGGGGFFDFAAFCSFFAVFGLSPCVRFVVGTDCTISITTMGCSSGRSRLIDGKPIHASVATLTCNPTEIISERRSISSVPRKFPSCGHYFASGSWATNATFSNPAA